MRGTPAYFTCFYPIFVRGEGMNLFRVFHTLIFSFIILVPILKAEDNDFPLIDKTYQANIGEVRLYSDIVQYEFPIWKLGDPASVLDLEFDDLDGGDKYFEYTLVHCSSDWSERSDIDISEYSDGFLFTEVDNYEYSFNTKMNYTHYTVHWDNDSAPWTKSGNYLLVVWDVSGDEKELSFTRRFLVVDSKVTPEVTYSLPLKTSQQRTHQGFQIKMDLSDLPLKRPREYIWLSVYQNMRWDHVLSNIKYHSYRGSQLFFDGPDQIIFPGLKEFRTMDIRTLKWRTKDVFRIEPGDETYQVILEKTFPRTYKEHLGLRDRNGTYYPDNLDYTNQGILRLEYVNVLFTLVTHEIENKRIYVTGNYWGWGVSDRMEMVYDESRSAYFLNALLKQGYYDYTLVLVDRETGKKDIVALEGSSVKTDNDYQICVYYRDPGENYDQLIGLVNYRYLKDSYVLYKSGVRIQSGK